MNAVDLPLREVLSGRISVARQALQQCGMLESIRQITFSAVADTTSSRIAQDLECLGLEQLHNLVTAPQASTIRTKLETDLKSITTKMTLAFCELLPRQGQPIYLGKHFGVRIMLPEGIVAVHRAALEDKIGFMLPHDLHMDSWYNTGVNSINLWMAIGRVRRGNGLLIYPGLYRQKIQRQGSSIDPDTPVGKPVNFEMEPGDVLVFAGDHLHASEPNTTNETRYVLTKRISLGAPRYSLHGNSWVPYYDTRLLGTALEPLASLRARFSLSYARHVLRTAGRVLTSQRRS
ncbi:MAG: phytanoyl-CoA dioxygenase family protein [Egibacteraceae bacterium]